MKKILFCVILFSGSQVYGAYEKPYPKNRFDTDLKSLVMENPLTFPASKNCAEFWELVRVADQEQSEVWDLLLLTEEKKISKFDLYLIILTNGQSDPESKIVYLMYSDRIIITNKKIREGLIEPPTLSAPQAKKAYEDAVLAYYNTEEQYNKAQERLFKAIDDLHSMCHTDETLSQISILSLPM